MPFWNFVFFSVLFFTLTVLCLVAVLTVVESLVVKKGNVRIKINDADPIPAKAGKNVLLFLSENKIFLPSACGGRGECGVCTCKIPKGGGELLPTETAQISLRHQREHVRLACQVKIREDMEIVIPQEIFSVKKFECQVISNRNVSTFIKELTLSLPEGQPFDFRAGGYVQIYVPKYKLTYRNFDIPTEYKGDWDKYKLWDLKAQNDEEIFRAYSMANYPG